MNEPAERSRWRLFLAWIVVLVPLAYGVLQTLRKAAALFS